MKAGDKIKIYGKPVTREDFEGDATLIEEYLPDEGDGLSMWVVTFDDSPGVQYLRTIYKEQTK